MRQLVPKPQRHAAPWLAAERFSEAAAWQPSSLTWPAGRCLCRWATARARPAVTRTAQRTQHADVLSNITAAERQCTQPAGLLLLVTSRTAVHRVHVLACESIAILESEAVPRKLMTTCNVNSQARTSRPLSSGVGDNSQAELFVSSSGLQDG